jgi:hypothetical protein
LGFSGVLGDIKAAQNIDINANQTYQNEGKLNRGGISI